MPTTESSTGPDQQVPGCGLGNLEAKPKPLAQMMLF